MNPVDRSGELRRIAALPRRTLPPEGSEQLSGALGRGTLRPVQAQALAELHLCRGLLAPISVGAGKTLISYLSPEVVGSKRPLLIVPAKLRGKTYRDFDRYSEDWHTSNPPAVVSYELLSRRGDWLETYQPDLIIADEAHRLKNIHAACTRRVGRYMSKHPSTIFVALSGTLTSRSLSDFAHIAEWCLGLAAPVPLDRYELESWCQALDEEGQWSDCRRPPGALLELGPGDNPRDIYRRRLIETPGVVASQGQGCPASILISPWGVKPPVKIQEALKLLRRKWELPDGQQIISAADLWRHAREISLGFWYRWDPLPPPLEWLEIRREWCAYVREVLSRSRTLDTEGDVLRAHPDRATDWLAVRGTYTPRTVPEWITTDVLDAVDLNDGIIWVEHRIVGEYLDRRYPYYGEMGRGRAGDIDDARGPVCASIAACSEGRNLQRYGKNLLLSVPTTGDRWEQLLGRTHREGQTADTVEVEVYLGCAESRDGFRQAVSDATYQSELTGEVRKLLIADLHDDFAEVKGKVEPWVEMIEKKRGTVLE
jgi:hypothetical protein